ncbi:tyrosine-type recombinase/integrase [Bacillus thermotolerans]|uniref:tyrosine-type recombinase/integrase n=1 Tax=Bacillus thermotolerans TaxID=1221996 RepID=UPI00058334B5|nr:tyrosine-type recombinase/integrase [Bacillus thermotolerans]KKB34757.1 Site-specific recombinase XerD [Bacillus thermotolerans]
MNSLSLLEELASADYLAHLQQELSRKHLLDEHRNLNLSNSSEQEFLELFFSMNLFKEGKPLSPHTMKAYRSDAKTLLIFLMDHSLSFRDIGFPEVKAYNRFITDTYAAKSAIRKLEFFRRLLDFGYETQFYQSHLSTWITKPVSKKGHYSKSKQAEKNRTPLRELSQADAERILSFFPQIVKSKRNQEQLKTRNLLIGYLLYTTGLRASELLSLNWGSFRYSRQGHVFVDVIGKGNKERTVPIREEVKRLLFDYRESIHEPTELDPSDQSPLFFALYNREAVGQEKKRLTYAALYKIVKEAVELAGRNTHVSPHWFRHTFVTMMLEYDVPLAVVKDWAGHADISTTNMYLERVNQDKMHAHLDKVQLF